MNKTMTSLSRSLIINVFAFTEPLPSYYNIDSGKTPGINTSIIYSKSW